MTDVYEDQYIDFSDGATLLQALRGEFGPQVQAEAAEMADLELEGDEYEGGDPSDADAAWGESFMAQQRKLEEQLQRPLSKKERDALASQHYESDSVPDLKEDYDRIIGRNIRNSDDRQAVATEVYQEAEAEKADPEAVPSFGGAE